MSSNSLEHVACCRHGNPYLCMLAFVLCNRPYISCSPHVPCRESFGNEYLLTCLDFEMICAGRNCTFRFGIAIFLGEQGQSFKDQWLNFEACLGGCYFNEIITFFFNGSAQVAAPEGSIETYRSGLSEWLLMTHVTTYVRVPPLGEQRKEYHQIVGSRWCRRR